MVKTSNEAANGFEGVIIDLGFITSIDDTRKRCNVIKDTPGKGLSGTPYYMPRKLLTVSNLDCGNSIDYWDMFSLGKSFESIIQSAVVSTDLSTGKKQTWFDVDLVAARNAIDMFAVWMMNIPPNEETFKANLPI